MMKGSPKTNVKVMNATPIIGKTFVMKRVSLWTLCVSILAFVGKCSACTRRNMKEIEDRSSSSTSAVPVLRSLLFQDYYYKEGVNYGDYNDVYWAPSTYLLTADSFEYQENGEEPASIANALEYMIGGDPGWLDLGWLEEIEPDWPQAYHSIEVEWTSDSGADLRFYAYFYSDDGSTWYSDEARTRMKTGEDWISFEDPDFKIGGNMGECFHMDKLDVTNGNGDTLTFVNLDLAPFAHSSRWENPLDPLWCVNGALLTLDSDQLEAQKSAFLTFVAESNFIKKEQMFEDEVHRLVLLGLSDTQKEVTFCWIQENTVEGMYLDNGNRCTYTFTTEECEAILNNSLGKSPSTPNPVPAQHAKSIKSPKVAKLPKVSKSPKSSWSYKSPKVKEPKNAKSAKLRR